MGELRANQLMVGKSTLNAYTVQDMIQKAVQDEMSHHHFQAHNHQLSVC